MTPQESGRYGLAVMRLVRSGRVPRLTDCKWEQIERQAAIMRDRYLYSGKGCATRRKVVEARTGRAA